MAAQVQQMAASMLGGGDATMDLTPAEMMREQRDAMMWSLFGGTGFPENIADFSVTAGAPIGQPRGAVGGALERQYGSGQVTTTVRDLLPQYWQMPKATRSRWQQLLYEAGFLAEQPIEWGEIDPSRNDYEAWKDAVRYAAMKDVPLIDVLRGLADADAGDQLRAGGAGTPIRRPPIQLMSPEDAAALADDIGSQLLGRRLTDEEKQQVVTTLHSQQRSQQSARADVMVRDEGGGEYVEPTTPQTVIEGSIRDQRPTEAKAKDVADQFAQFLGLIGGGRA